MLAPENTNRIPVLDWNQFTTHQAAFVRKLRAAFHTTGFIILDNHPMNIEKIQKGEDAFKQFFKLPDSIKRKYEFPEIDHQIGYTPFHVEKAVGADLPDEKEFFHVFPSSLTHVAELPRFHQDVHMLWEEFFSFTNLFTRAVALSIGEPEDFFHQTRDAIGPSIVRGLHYPAQENPYQGGRKVVAGGNAIGMCAWEHQDINLLTFLLADEPGLELLHEDGGTKTWIEVQPTKKGQIIINVCDMMEPLTNGYYRSVIHRVRCRKNTDRYSVPFFFHPPSAFSLYPRPQFGPARPDYAHSTTAGVALSERLRQIGLKKT